MLLNGRHLMPDLSGALVWPKQRLVAVSDPIGDIQARQAPQQAAEALRALAAVLRQRQPARVLWLGGALPALIAANRLAKREADEISRMARAQDWTWIGQDLPAGLPGTIAQELALDGLTFRHIGTPGNALGEISAAPWPVATHEGATWPCFVMDGRRMVIPAFGGGPDGVNVLAPGFRPLFRRPFHVLILAGGRLLSRPRARLEDGQSPAEPAAKPVAPAGRRMRLLE